MNWPTSLERCGLADPVLSRSGNWLELRFLEFIRQKDNVSDVFCDISTFQSSHMMDDRTLSFNHR
jgi:hypothetical protein